MPEQQSAKEQLMERLHGLLRLQNVRKIRKNSLRIIGALW